MEKKIYTLTYHQDANIAHRGHNIRAASAIKYQNHIDPTLIGANIIFKDQSLREAYNDIFESAFQTYRKSAARPDRIKKSYYDTVVNDSRLNLCYEAIVEIGDHNTIGYRTSFTNEEEDAFYAMQRGETVSDEMQDAVQKVLDAQKAVEACKRFVDSWSDRNPGMYLFGAYLHADEKEGTIHMHLDYIPVVDKQQRGAPIQTALDRCCKKIVNARYTKAELNDRIPRKRGGQKSAENLWQNLQREDLKAIAHDIGLEVDWIRESPTPSKHLNTPEYKKLQEMIKDQEASIQKYANQAAKARLEISDLQDQIYDLRGMLATGNLELAEAKAKMDDLIQELEQAQKKVDQSEHQVSEKTAELDKLQAQMDDLVKKRDDLETEIEVLQDQQQDEAEMLQAVQTNRQVTEILNDAAEILSPDQENLPVISYNPEKRSLLGKLITPESVTIARNIWDEIQQKLKAADTIEKSKDAIRWIESESLNLSDTLYQLNQAEKDRLKNVKDEVITEIEAEANRRLRIASKQIQNERDARVKAENALEDQIKETNRWKRLYDDVIAVLRFFPKRWKQMIDKTHNVRLLEQMYFAAENQQQHPGVIYDLDNNYHPRTIFRFKDLVYDKPGLLALYQQLCADSKLPMDPEMKSEFEFHHPFSSQAQQAQDQEWEDPML